MGLNAGRGWTHFLLSVTLPTCALLIRLTTDGRPVGNNPKVTDPSSRVAPKLVNRH